MIRNLKALGLALVAVFAMSTVAVSGASAQEQGTLTSDGSVTLTATETGELRDNAMTEYGLIVVCPGSSYTGHKVIAKHETVTNPSLKHSLLASGERDFTLTPHYNGPNCKVDGLNWPMTIDMNGCDYVAHIGVTTGGVSTYGITFDLVCPTGKEITWTVWTPGEPEPHTNPPICVVHFAETGNQNLAGAHATDTTNGHLGIKGTIEGIDATRTKSATHPILCPESTTTIGKQDIDITVKGHSADKENTSIGISHP